jgi:hypothetical protein
MKKIMFALLFSIFMLSALTVPSLSQDVTVGVSVGDWFMYEATIVEWSAGPGVPFPPDQYVEFLYTANETDWQKYAVTDIVGSNVTFDVLSHWKNGTETTYEVEIDITSSSEGIEAYIVIGANLEPGDLLRDEFYLFGVIYYPPRYLNDSILVDYETETRETNVLDFDNPMFLAEDSFHSKQLWDKETGVLVKMEVIMNNTSSLGQKYFVIYEIELVDANLWVIPDFPAGTVMLLVFVAVTVSIAVYRRKKLKRQIG